MSVVVHIDKQKTKTDTEPKPRRKPLATLVKQYQHTNDAIKDMQFQIRDARLRLGEILLELRCRVESGEAGEGVKWWDWFDQNVQRSRGDAKKLLKLAASEDPEAAAEEAAQRNREHQAKHRAKAGAYVSAEQLERKARVKAYIEERKVKQDALASQKYDRQVGDLLEALKVHKKAGEVALTAINKFSPEAKASRLPCQVALAAWRCCSASSLIKSQRVGDSSIARIGVTVHISQALSV